MSDKIYYVYGLIDTKTQQCFYVGKGKNARMFHHEQKVRDGKSTGNQHLDHKIAKLIREETPIGCVKFFDQLTEDDAFTQEEAKIFEIGISNLCNMWTSGKRGKTPNAEILAKKSVALKGRKTAPRSEETKKKISAALSGRHNGPHSDETRAKIAEATKGKPKNITDEERNIRRLRMADLKESDGYREKLSKSQMGHAVTDETRAKIGAKHKGKKATAEQRQKRSEQCKGKKRGPYKSKINQGDVDEQIQEQGC